MLAAVLMVYRADQIRAVQTEERQAALEKRVTNQEQVTERLVKSIQGIQLSQVKVATLLDDHLRYTTREAITNFFNMHNGD